MIEMTSTTAAMLYLCVTMLAIFGIWVNHHYKNRQKKIVVVEKKLVVCEYCHFAYLYELSKHISQCPQCSCYNKNNE